MRPARVAAAAIFLFALLLAGWPVAGCAGKGNGASPTSQPASADISDRALKDPFKYSPDFSDTEMGTGRGPAEFDRKGLKKDIGNVLMP